MSHIRLTKGLGRSEAVMRRLSITLGLFLNEETSGSDYSEFMSRFAPFLGQIAGLTKSNT